jgi:hypothetical protein
MDEHRLVHSKNLALIPVEQPFSSFTFVDRRYGKENPAIRRLFSIARSHDALTLMIEEIEPAGIISDENGEIKRYATDYEMKGLERISFWRSDLATLGANIFRNKDCIGYAILKHDVVPSKRYDKWHVFEAVFEKYPDKHNCVPNPMGYSVVLGSGNISLEGLLYAQQNTLNKVCAQVALRSLISRIIRRDVSYSEINELARKVSPKDFDPSKGLSIERIQAVLVGFKIDFRDIDYNSTDDKYRALHLYQKHIYAGVESGAGALLGFHFTGPAIEIMKFVEGRKAPKHIIPFYGHTFNKDTWMPEADITYFRVGEKLGYIPSENWTSSFLGHDDNFGPCFCVPRLYISPDKVDYVVELLRPGIKFGGAQAEALALSFLYSVLNWRNQQTGLPQNTWLERLVYNAQDDVQRIIFRAITVERDTYIRHLSTEKDWDQNSEDKPAIDILRESLSNALWVVEVSIPQLFPANERKLGDIVLNGEITLSDGQGNRSPFLFMRLPGYYFSASTPGSSGPDFVTAPSKLMSHMPVIRLTETRL